jgi:hypothetical protein
MGNKKCRKIESLPPLIRVERGPGLWPGDKHGLSVPYQLGVQSPAPVHQPQRGRGVVPVSLKKGVERKFG